MSKLTASEKSVEDYLVRRVNDNGGYCFKLTNYKGIFDRIVILPGPWLAFAELKRPKGGVVAPAQRIWAKRLAKLGFKVYLIKTKGEVDELFRDYEDASV